MGSKINEPIISKYLYSKAAENKIPLAGTFELSPRCNMDCKMCYVKKTKKEVQILGGERTADEWIKLGKECKEAGMLFLLLTGGEPFLLKDFKKIYTELKKMGFMISINTNGTLIDEEVIEWLKKDPPYRINMTLYGGSNETYNRLCLNPKGFDQATKAAKMIKSAGIAIKLNASMTPDNIEDLEEIYNFGRENNIYVQATPYMFPPTRRDESKIGCNERFTPKEAAYYKLKIDKLKLDKNEYLQRIHSITNCNLNKENINFKESKEGEKLRCRAGRSTFWINWKGEMSPCGMMNDPVTYPFKDGFLDAWYSIIDKTDEIRMPIKCTNCKNRQLCFVCAASVVTETGGYNKPPIYLCSMTKEIIQEAKKECEEVVV